MSKSKARKTAEAVVTKTTALPVAETPIQPPAPKVEAPEVKEPVENDITKAIKNAVIPAGTTHVFVTSDGQVFLPVNQTLASRHAEKNRLKLTKHTL